MIHVIAQTILWWIMLEPKPYYNELCSNRLLCISDIFAETDVWSSQPSEEKRYIQETNATTQFKIRGTEGSTQWKWNIYSGTWAQKFRNWPINVHICKYIECFITVFKMSAQSAIFLLLLKNICCGYSLEDPCRGTSNECHNVCFLLN